MANIERKRWDEYDELELPDGTRIDMAKLLDEQARARTALVHLIPYFAEFISKFRFIYTFHVQTQATDGRDIFINPKFTADLDFTGKVFVMAHEVMHCVLNHIRRGMCQGHDPEKSNVAADYECNITLATTPTTSGKPLVSIQKIEALGALIDPKYQGWGYEKIYDNCTVPSWMKQKQQQPNQGNGQGQGSNQGSQRGQQSNSQGNGQGNNSGQSNQAGNGQGSGQGGQQSNNQQGNPQGQGSGQGGQQSNNQGNIGKVSASDMTDATQSSQPGSMVSGQDGDRIAQQEGYDKNSQSQDSAAREWENDVQKSINKAPAGLKEKLQQIFNTNTDWVKILKKIIGRSINNSATRQAYANKNALASQSRISRTDKDRFDAVDFIMCCIDTSGSLSGKQLHLILSEVYAMALQKKPISLAIVMCDTKIQDIQIYNNIRDFKRAIKDFEIHGGGGTDMHPCWDLLNDDPRFVRRNCELFMMFTDGYLDQIPRNKRKMGNLCWCITDNPGFQLEHNDTKTFVVHLDSSTIK